MHLQCISRPGVARLVLRAVLARVEGQRDGLRRQRRLDAAPRAVPGALATLLHSSTPATATVGMYCKHAPSW